MKGLTEIKKDNRKPLKEHKPKTDWRNKPKGIDPHAAPRWATEGTARVIHGVKVKQMIDMTLHLGIDEFDDMVRAIEAVVRDSNALALDNAEDCVALCDRLLFALGGEPPERKTT